MSCVARVLSGLFVCSLAAAAGEPQVQIGPFTTGMSLEQAQAAAPQLAWRITETSAYTGKALAVGAIDAIVLGGAGHSVEIEPGYYGAYVMRFDHVAGAANADACEKVTVSILADLEARFGKFSAEPRYETRGSYGLPRWETQRTSNGIIVLPVPGSGSVPSRTTLPHDRVKAGKRSVMIFEDRASDSGSRRGFSEHTKAALRVRIDSTYDAGARAENCRIQTLVDVRGTLPSSRTMDLTPELLDRHVTVGLKHHSLDGVTLPVSVVLDCNYLRHDARFNCAAAQGQAVEPAALAAAQARIGSLQLDSSMTDPDNPVPLLANPTIVLAASDRRPLDFAKSPRTTVREIRWTRYPRADEIEAYRTAGSGIVPVACQVQSDASLICAALDATKEPVPPTSATVSQRAAVEIIRRYVPAATLKSGAPAAGSVFETSVDFRR